MACNYDIDRPCESFKTQIVSLILVRVKHYHTLPDTPVHKAHDTSEWAVEKIRITRKWLDKIGTRLPHG